MKKLNKILQVSPLALAVSMAATGLAPMAAQAEWSANIGVTSNYMWRGMTQADDGPAVSGGLDYDFGNGFAVGTWISNVDFVDTTGDQYEIDFYGSYSGELTEDLGFSVGAIYYAYPDAEAPDGELDFTEVNASISYKFLTAGLDYTVDTEAGGDDENIHYYVGAGFDLAETWSLGGTVGHTDWDAAAAEDYTWFQVDLGKSAGDLGDFTVSASVIDDDAAGDDDIKLFVSWGKGF